MQSVHKAVLLHDVVKAFRDVSFPNKKDLWFVDGTLGGGGHSLAIAESFSGRLHILGLDLDKQAIDRVRPLLEGQAQEVILENENYRNIDKVLEKHGIKEIDMFLVDLGLSSDELENSGKGFTFQKDEPLLMTFGDPETYPFTAKSIINNWKEEDIANVIFAYGEDKYARRIAKRIVEYRTKTPIETSADLAEIVKGAYPRTFRKPRLHPATRTFQALRIAVNDELNALKDGLDKAYQHLAHGGVMAVISFHSLEDRIVKNFYKKCSQHNEDVISKKPIVATSEEIENNQRSRSAKLRVLTKK